MNVLMIFLIIPQFVFSFNGKCAGKVRQNTILGELHKITSPKSIHIVQYCTSLFSPLPANHLAFTNVLAPKPLASLDTMQEGVFSLLVRPGIPISAMLPTPG